MIGLLADVGVERTKLNVARTAVLEYLDNVGPSDQVLQVMARRSVLTLGRIAQEQGYGGLEDVPPRRVVRAVDLLVTLKLTGVEDNDPAVARYLELRIRETLTPDEDEDDYEDDHAGTDAAPGEEAPWLAPHREESRLSAELSATLSSIGATVRYEHSTGEIRIVWRGTDMVAIHPRRSSASWVDPELGRFLKRAMEYNGLVQGLQGNRGPSSAGLRQLLRENLSVDVLVAEARAAGATVEQRGSVATKKYSFTHRLVGEFLEVTVPRGQNHVIDVAFDSPETFRPLSFFVAFVYKSNEVDSP